MLFLRVVYSAYFNEICEFSTHRSRTHPSSCSGSVVPRATKYVPMVNKNRLSEQWGGSALGGSWTESWDSSSYRIGSRSFLPRPDILMDAPPIFGTGNCNFFCLAWKIQLFVPIHVFIFDSATRKKILSHRSPSYLTFRVSQGRSLATSFPSPLNFETKLIVSLICCDAGGEKSGAACCGPKISGEVNSPTKKKIKLLFIFWRMRQMLFYFFSVKVVSKIALIYWGNPLDGMPRKWLRRFS